MISMDIKIKYKDQKNQLKELKAFSFTTPAIIAKVIQSIITMELFISMLSIVVAYTA